MARIGVENGLTDVAEALRQQGHEVVELHNENDANGCDCCVVTGRVSSVMGIMDTTTKNPILTAAGYTADELCQQVSQHINQQ